MPWWDEADDREDSSADLLLKQALQEVGRASLLEKLTPEFFRVSKMFEQADCNIKPSALFGIALGFGFVGGLDQHLARQHLCGAGGRQLALQLAVDLAVVEAEFAAEEIRGPVARRDGIGGASPACRALAGRRLARGRRGNARADLQGVRPRVRGTKPGHPVWKTPWGTCATACRTSTCGSS